jgi:hypothetical protein
VPVHYVCLVCWNPKLKFEKRGCLVLSFVNGFDRNCVAWTFSGCRLQLPCYAENAYNRKATKAPRSKQLRQKIDMATEARGWQPVKQWLARLPHERSSTLVVAGTGITVIPWSNWHPKGAESVPAREMSARNVNRARADLFRVFIRPDTKNQAHSACDVEIQDKEDYVVHRIPKVETERNVFKSCSDEENWNATQQRIPTATRINETSNLLAPRASFWSLRLHN